MYDDINIRLRFYLSRLRCNICYAPYSKQCMIYLCEPNAGLGQEKLRFIVDRHPNDMVPFELQARYPVQLAALNRIDIKSLLANRLTLTTNKERDFRSVLCLEIYCSKCNNFKSLEIDIENLLSDKYTIPGRQSPYIEQEDDDF